MDPNQDATSKLTPTTQDQSANPAQVAADPGSQHSSLDQMSGPPYSGPITKTIPTEKTISLGSHAVVVGPSGVHIDGVEVNPSQPPASISGGAAINQGNSILVASQIFHLPLLKQLSTTVIAGQTVVPVASGVLIQGTPVTGTSPIIIFGTTVSVDPSHLFIGGNSYPLSTVNPTAVIILANGVIVLPMSNAVSIYGTTLTAGTPAAIISGTAVSLDFSIKIIFDGTAQALPSSFPQPILKTVHATTVNNVAVQQLLTGISVAGTILTPGAPLISASGSLVSLGSSFLAIGTSSVPVPFGTTKSLITTIGGQVVKGLESGGSTGNGSSISGAGRTGAYNGTISGVQTFEGKAVRFRRSDLEGLTSLATMIALSLYLHIL